MSAAWLRPTNPATMAAAQTFVFGECAAGDIILVGPTKMECVLVRFIIGGEINITPAFRRFVLVGSALGEVSNPITVLIL